ncbi:hypothetical protein ACFRAR_36900 [Kitasatospora sp. NPDC056651]|uniref:hypothetical protein n=1 Tax=Kitasatospora sp. NPDC056651 TaxID=3345892 RepID=UPI0036AC4A73
MLRALGVQSQRAAPQAREARPPAVAAGVEDHGETVRVGIPALPQRGHHPAGREEYVVSPAQPGEPQQAVLA